MKNLEVWKSATRSLWTEDSYSEHVRVAISSDCPGLMFVCVNLQLVQYEADGSQKVLLNVSDEVPSVSESHVLELVFFSIQRLLCLFLTTGEIITIDIDSKEVIIPNVDEFCYQGLKSVGVSPDQEIVVVLTSDNQVLLFDSMFNVINKTELYSSHFGEGEFITVGWGKKETQFHGSEGKQAAHKKNNFESNIELDNDKSCITWRGDGSYFAVGFVKESQSFFKVYNREGVLQFTSEKQPSLECMFVWRPTGNLIATTQIFPNKYVVAFFEKNGLRHGELVLPFKQDQVTVKNLSWSGDSEILSLWYLNNESKTNHILLYTINNYHWYLKQSLVFNQNSQILSVVWEDSLSDNNGKCLHIISNNGLHNKVEWIWSINQSNGKGETDDATVAVIDGNKILLTSFRYSVVPPPMAANIIECDKNVNRIIFGPILTNSNAKDENGIDSNSFCAFKEDGTCDMYIKENNKYIHIGSANLGILKNEMNVFNVIWLSKDTLVWVESDSSSDLHSVKIVFKPHLVLDSTSVTQFKKRIIGIKPISEQSVVLQSDSGELFSCSLQGVEKSEISFPETCYRFDATYIDNDLFVFGLTNRNRFYINDVKIANNVNSYHVHSDFLLLTTLQHQLLSCPLKHDYLKKLQNGVDKSNFTEQNENCFMNRKVERGAHLVTVVSCDTRTVLQLPRGNLEVIQPRALSLKIVEKYLNNKDYRSAFDLMRKQRINLNLIYDHNPEMFVENIDVFIKNIDNTNWLSLFISELDDQDVTKTMYLGAYANEHKIINKTFEKVKTVCSLTRKELEKLNENNKYILPILTTYVKNNTIKDLENALIAIKCIKDDEHNVISANDALKYLLYMVNVEELYNIALGLYDFELVMFVANKSQKDPKEYVPYINKLKSMEENYRKFTIDNDLKRYESALRHLIECGDEKSDELLIFIKQHCLYSKALNLIANDDLRYKNVAEEFGGFLESKRHFTEAGMMYLRCGILENALKCFTEALEWRTVIDIANKMEYSHEKMLVLKRLLLNKLKEVGRYSEIVDLITDLPSFSVEDILKYALEGKLFKLSLSVCQKHHKEDLIDSVVRPAILEQYENLLSTIDQNAKQFDNQKNRLFIVRQNKAIKATNEDENMVADCDLYSDTSSIVGSSSSKSSGRSHRSSKNRRKHERKMASLKEGSRFEDVALVRALYSLVSSTFDLRKDIKEIGFALHWLSLDCEIKQLQGKLDVVLNEMTKNFNTIWIPELNIEANKSIGVDLKTQDITTITDASFSLEPHIRIPPVIRDLKWKIEYL